MHKTFVLMTIFIFIPLLTACAGFNLPLQTPATASAGSGNGPSPTNQVGNKTLLAPTLDSRITEAIYTIKKLAPQKRNAKFGKDSFLSKYDLLVQSNNNISLVDLSNGEIQLKQSVPENSYQLIVSTDNTTLAYLSFQTDQTVLSITNLVSGISHTVALPTDAFFIQWVSNERIVVWGKQGKECPYLLFIYDVVSGSKDYPKHSLPDFQKSDCIQLPIINIDGTKVLFPWAIYDLSAGDTKIIEFMKDVPKIPPDYSFRWSDDHLSGFYLNENELYFSLNIRPDQIGDSSSAFEAISLPGFATRGGWWEPASWSSDMMQIGLDLIAADVNSLDYLATNKNIPIDYYSIRLDQKEIVDYSLNRSVLADGVSWGVLEKGFISPDGKYLAWTIYDKISHQPLESHILEQDTGLIMSIPAIDIIGWTVQ